MNGNLAMFERGALSIDKEQFVCEMISRFGLTETQARGQLERLLSDEVWINVEYQVNIDKNVEHGFKDMTIWHLSIKRRDKSPIHDWRDLQQIKNILCGPDVEAIELYPAEDRLVDSANQYHLWAFMPNAAGDQPPRVPIGWTARFTSEKSEFGAVQRPHDSV